jgi:hypothetical protein
MKPTYFATARFRAFSRIAQSKILTVFSIVNGLGSGSIIIVLYTLSIPGRSLATVVGFKLSRFLKECMI